METLRAGIKLGRNLPQPCIREQLQWHGAHCQLELRAGSVPGGKLAGVLRCGAMPAAPQLFPKMVVRLWLWATCGPACHCRKVRHRFVSGARRPGLSGCAWGRLCAGSAPAPACQMGGGPFLPHPPGCWGDGAQGHALLPGSSRWLCPLRSGQCRPSLAGPLLAATGQQRLLKATGGSCLSWLLSARLGLSLPDPSRDTRPFSAS